MQITKICRNRVTRNDSRILTEQKKLKTEPKAVDRERRRYLQNKENGIEMPYEEILESVKNRDFIDSTREIAPLKKADDAIYVDSSNMTIDEVVERIKKIISEKRK